MILCNRTSALIGLITPLILAGSIQGQIPKFDAWQVYRAPEDSDSDAVGIDMESIDLNGDGLRDILYLLDGITVNIASEDGSFTPARSIGEGEDAFRLATADLDKDGDIDIVVALENTDALAVYRNNGNATFQTPLYVNLSGSQTSVDIADFDGDGHLDIVALVRADNSTQIAILRNNGARTLGFEQPYYETATSFAFDIVAEDIDGDGFPDLTVADLQAANQVFLNEGDGTFGSPVNYPAGVGSISIYLVDMNGDGILDQVVSNLGTDAGKAPTTPDVVKGSSNSSVSVLFGNGDGTYQRTRNTPLEVSAYGLAIGDYDGDGDMDVFAPGYKSYLSVLLFNDGSGVLGTPESFITEDGSITAVADDFDRDGQLDIGYVNVGAHGIVLARNFGEAIFAPRSYPTDRYPYDIAVGNFDGDDFPDIVSANHDPDTISILLNDNSGAMAPPVNLTGTKEPAAVVTGRVDDDAFDDIAVAGNDEVSVYFGRGDGTFSDPVTFEATVTASNDEPVDLVLGDFFGDDETDIAVLLDSTGTRRFLIFENNGDRTFRLESTPTIQVETAVAIEAADMNGDSLVDIVITGRENADGRIGNPSRNRISVTSYLNDGTGNYNSNFTFDAGPGYPGGLAIQDLDGNNSPDVAVSDRTNDEVLTIFNEGNGRLDSPVRYPVGYNPSNVAIADFTMDEVYDLVTLNSEGGHLSVLAGSADGTFQRSFLFVNGLYPSSLAVADFDRDGDPDVALCSVEDLDHVVIASNLAISETTNGGSLDYTFDSNQEGWNFSSAGSFAAPTSAFENGAIVLTANNNTNTFGFYTGPFADLPAGDTGLYVAEFTLATDVANRAAVPQARVRMNNEEFSYSKFLAIESSGLGQYSPTSTPGTYPLYFAAPANLGRVAFSFDLLNFAADDATNGDLQLDGVTIRAADLGASSDLRVEKTWSFTGGAEGWNSVTAPGVYTQPTFSASGGALNITGVARDTNTFGFWTSPQEVTMDGSRLYIATFLVSSDVPAASKDRVPQIRMRVNESGLRASTFLAIESNQTAAFSPTSGGSSEFKVYLSAPPVSTGSFLIASFDFLNFDSSDDSSATVSLESVLIESIAKP